MPPPPTGSGAYGAYRVVNVDIFSLINSCASGPSRHFHMDRFSRKYWLILFFLLGFSFPYNSNFPTSKALREMRKKMYCAKISMFTVYKTFSWEGALLLLSLNHIQYNDFFKMNFYSNNPDRSFFFLQLWRIRNEAQRTASAQMCVHVYYDPFNIRFSIDHFNIKFSPSILLCFRMCSIMITFQQPRGIGRTPPHQF